MTYTDSFFATPEPPRADPFHTAEASLDQVRVLVCWGNAVVSVHHVARPRAFVLGDGSVACDLVVPAELLAGRTAFELVRIDGPDAVRVRVPAGAQAVVATAGAERSAGAAVELVLTAGMQINVRLGALRFEIRGVGAEAKLPRVIERPGRGLAGTVLSAAMHLGILAATAAFMPALGPSDADEITIEQRYQIQQYLESAAEIEREQARDAATDGGPNGADETASAAGPAEGQPRGPRGPSSSAGGPAGGQASDATPMSREQALADASRFGIIEQLIAAEQGNLPSFGPVEDLPGGPGDALWQDSLLDGPGPLALTQPCGEDSNAGPSWYSLPSLMPSVPHAGFDRRPVRLAGNREPSGPSLRMREPVDASKGIPAAVIQRIVRANFGRFRACYESGLRTNPSLQGRVAVRFLIGRDGTVAGASDGGSDLSDKSVVGCVVGAFRSLTFPAPEQGMVTVTYPLQLVPPSQS